MFKHTLKKLYNFIYSGKPFMNLYTLKFVDEDVEQLYEKNINLIYNHMEIFSLSGVQLFIIITIIRNYAVSTKYEFILLMIALIINSTQMTIILMYQS